MINRGSRLVRSARIALTYGPLGLLTLSIGSGVTGPGLGEIRAEATTAPQLPPVPANGELGFVIEGFGGLPSVGKRDCSQGGSGGVRENFRATLPAAERERLLKKENEVEFEKRWKATIFGPNNTNICTNYDKFERPMMRTVQSKFAWGFDLDGSDGNAGSADTCAHENFTTPDGQAGIDNQAFRAMGCAGGGGGEERPAALEQGGDRNARGGMSQFFASGEWTQVILIRGIDSMVRDDDVEIVYGNTGQAVPMTPAGEFLRNASFTIDDQPPRERNVLRGKIVNGVLTTTEAKDIRLAQTWGQGQGRGDLRGLRTKFDLRKARMRLEFKPDGTLDGLVGGYTPVWMMFAAPALGGAGSATTANIDCAAQYVTLKKLADGIKDPKTGECTGVSTAMRLRAIPAYVNDVPSKAKSFAASK
jgi:hypothetical protein